MNNLDKSKEELIIELNELQAENKSLQEARNKDYTQLLLKSSIESPIDMIILSIDLHYQYLFFNSFHHRIMLKAYGKDVKLGMNLLDCISNVDDREKAKKNYDRALNGESHITIEEYGDIERYYYETRYNPILNDENEVIGATAFSSNVTERKLNELLSLENTQKITSQNKVYLQLYEELAQTNDELRKVKEKAEEGEKKYKLLYDYNPMPMSIFDSESLKFLSVNEAFIDKYGYTREEFLNMTILEIRPDTEIEKLKQSVSLVDKGVTNAGIFLHKKKNGEIIKVEIIRHELMFDNRIAKLVLVNDVSEKIKAEEGLQKSEIRFRNFFINAPVGVNGFDAEGRVISVNSVARNYFGVSETDPLSAYRLFEDPSILDETKWKIKHGQVATEERYIDFKAIRQHGMYMTTKSDQDKIFVKLTYTPYGADINNPEGFIAIIQDITDRRQAEEALVQTSKLLDITSSIAKLGGWELDLISGELYWSKETYRIHEVDISIKPSVASSQSFYAPEAKKQLEAFVQNAIEYGIPWEYELPMSTAKGKQIWVRGKGLCLKENGKVIKLYGFFQDITERKQAEEALLKSKLLLSETEKIGKVGGWEFNIDTMEQIWTDEVYNIHEVELNSNQTVDKGINYYTNECRPVIEKAVQRAIEFGEPFDLELEITTAKGNVRNVHTIGKVDLANRRIYGFFQNLTERKLAEDKIKVLNETLEQKVIERTAQLEEAVKELEAFTYSVSHDLRAPLRHINGFVDLLSEKFQDTLPEKGKHYLDTIADSTRHMGTLIDDLLQFSRTGRQEMHHSKLDMNTLFQEVLKRIKQDVSNRNINWVVGHLPPVVGDYSLLQLVWMNLLSNAVKFSSRIVEARIEIGVKKEENEYVFFVRDNGAGFDMQYAHKLFGVFQRLHSAAEFEGTGIGLANVRRIISKHGGRTWAEAELDKGATFYFSLPKMEVEGRL